MGHNSVVQNPGQIFGGENSIFNNASQIFGGPNSIFHNPLGALKPGGSGGAGAVPAAPPPAPDPNNSVSGALYDQLTQELQMRRSSASVTGGKGVTAMPTTQSAGQMLLGS